MAAPRFYCPEIPAHKGMANLPEQAAHHAARVLRTETAALAAMQTLWGDF